MSLQRPLVSVYNSEKKGEVKKSVALPDVFLAPIRTDVVNTIFCQQEKNKRQPYAVNRYAGLQTAAESWGTGRAVSRIPRVPGGGTHRAGQGAFGNMCRGGRLFAPTKTWRRWANKIPKSQRRFARVSCIAASSEASLLEARGHKIDTVAEIPLVVSDEIQSYTSAKVAVKFLQRVGAHVDCAKSKNSKHIRPGKGKYRNRRYKQKLGPLIVYKEDQGLVKAFRNISGIDLCRVDSLDISKLAPGGVVGRFIIWTESAFNELNSLFGSYGDKGVESKLKRRNRLTFKLPRAVIENTDITRIIESDAVQSVVRDRIIKKKTHRRKVNPLKNKKVMQYLNPAAKN